MLLSAPCFGIVLQCLWDEDLDRDEAVEFLHRAEAALLDDTPALFPPTASQATSRPGGPPAATAPPDGYRHGSR